MKGRGTCLVLGFVLLAGCRFGDFTPDAGIDDAAPIDGMIVYDASPPDASPPDASPPDASLPDAMPPDAGTHPIGPLGDGLSTLAGYSISGTVDGAREVSLFNNPVNVVVGPNGNIYVADFDGNAIREITPAGVTTTLVRQMGFARPFGMVFTETGELYVQTDRNSLNMNTGALWQVALDTGLATLVLDNSGRLRAMANLSDGTIIVGDAFNHTLQIFDPVGITLTALAGENGVPGFADGMGNLARFDRPTDIVVTAAGDILISDVDNNRIRQVTLAGEVTTVAGNGVDATVNGTALGGSLSRPSGLTLNGDTLYISSFNGGVIRQFSGGMLTTIAGSSPGFTDNVNPLLGQLYGCEGLDFVPPFLYIADGNSGEDGPFHRVRRLTIP